jgi:hypothetical protein
MRQHQIDREVATPSNGAEAPSHVSRERCYCATCGIDVANSGSPIERFGESSCSEAHAAEFVEAVRVARTQATATLPSVPETARCAKAGGTGRRGWRTYLGRALCWGVPLLAVVVLLGGGTAVFGAASGLLPVLAVLACPLGMYLMMRSMAKTAVRDDPHKGEEW